MPGWLMYALFVIIAGAWVLSGRNPIELIIYGIIVVGGITSIMVNVSEKREKRKQNKEEAH